MHITLLRYPGKHAAKCSLILCVGEQPCSDARQARAFEIYLPVLCR